MGADMIAVNQSKLYSLNMLLWNTNIESKLAVYKPVLPSTLIDISHPHSGIRTILIGFITS